MEKVLILEDEPNTLDLISLVVSNTAELEVITAVATIAQATAYIQEHELPDVYLIDLGLPDGSGIEFIRHVRQISKDAHIMVISVFGDETNVICAIEAGADGYIHKDEPMDEISKHIKSMLRGDAPISPSIAKYILQKMRSTSVEVALDDCSLQPALTDREIGILKILARGYSRQEVAAQLGISLHTVSVHIKRVYSKLSVHSRTEAIYEACQLGIISIRD